MPEQTTPALLSGEVTTPTVITCACCPTPLPPGTRAKINADGVIVCVDCAEALSHG